MEEVKSNDLVKVLADVHQSAFGEKGWSADEILKLKQSGAEVVGSENAMIIYRAAADEAEILTIAVHPDFRRQGLASALIGLMERELKKGRWKKEDGRSEEIINKIFLEVSVENEAAIALYKSLGFREEAKRPGYYQGVDAVLMVKEI